MSSSTESIQPDRYVDAVLSEYTALPETPVKSNAADRKTAWRLLDREVPLPVVQTALALGSLRRLGRPSDSPRLQPIRSLAYFLPVIDELLQSPVPHDYATYLRAKLKRYAAETLHRPPSLSGARPKNYVSS